ncbi:hypothetical protein [uncultured Flavobacterium sp.]|uniref:hypothetical protein n=1 Tax=uncultured Flavobacterium sp. TaxID=165435 RepID=UPI0025E9E679|nr:hypothetical protein [uncultured Flavobacterium sp.]
MKDIAKEKALAKLDEVWLKPFFNLNSQPPAKAGGNSKSYISRSLFSLNTCLILTTIQFIRKDAFPQIAQIKGFSFYFFLQMAALKIFLADLK